MAVHACDTRWGRWRQEDHWGLMTTTVTQRLSQCNKVVSDRTGLLLFSSFLSIYKHTPVGPDTAKGEAEGQLKIQKVV